MYVSIQVSQVEIVVKNPTVNAGEMRFRFDPWSGRSSGGEQGNRLQYSCLENPMDRGDWWDTAHILQSQTQMK